MNYHLVAVGGTFDRFHKGHEQLLKTAFSEGARVVVGITGDAMVREKILSTIIAPFNDRKKEVEKFLDKNNLANRSSIVPLSDPYGPLLTDKTIEALIVGPKFSKEIISRVLGKLPIVYCPAVRTTTQQYLSSTDIRLGQVNRKGAVYDFPSKPIHLPETVRKFLKKPLGNLLTTLPLQTITKAPFTISVGDETTKRLLENGIIPHLSVIDFSIGRIKKYEKIEDLGFSPSMKVVSAVNPPGILTPSLARAIKESFKDIVAHNKQEVIVVDGEEDLATLLCILFAPLSSVVLYGQPKQGLVVVNVTEEKKEEIALLLSTFTQSS